MRRIGHLYHSNIWQRCLERIFHHRFHRKIISIRSGPGSDRFKSWYRDIQKRIEADTDYGIDLLPVPLLIDEVLEGDQVLISEDRIFLHECKRCLQIKRAFKG